MKCEICGTEYKDTDRFCGMCGTPNPLYDIKNGTKITMPAPAEPVTEYTEPAEELTETAEPILEPISEPVAPEPNFPDPTQSAAAAEPFGNIADTFHEADNIPEIVEANEADEPAELSSTHDIPQSTETQIPASVPKPEEETNINAAPEITVTHHHTDTRSAPRHKAEKKQKPPKEKRVCSLSAVVICVIIILILSVACGALGGLYLGERTRVQRMRQGAVVPYSYSEFNTYPF